MQPVQTLLSCWRMRFEFFTLRRVSRSDVCVHSQKFKNNGLLAHENEVNKLHAEGIRLVEMNHPGSPTIRVRLSAECDHSQDVQGLKN